MFDSVWRDVPFNDMSTRALSSGGAMWMDRVWECDIEENSCEIRGRIHSG